MLNLIKNKYHKWVFVTTLLLLIEYLVLLILLFSKENTLLSSIWSCIIDDFESSNNGILDVVSSDTPFICILAELLFQVIFGFGFSVYYCDNSEKCILSSVACAILTTLFVIFALFDLKTNLIHLVLLVIIFITNIFYFVGVKLCSRHIKAAKDKYYKNLEEINSSYAKRKIKTGDFVLPKIDENDNYVYSNKPKNKPSSLNDNDWV